MSNAFAPVLRARPCPIFGRPAHRRGTSPQTLRIPIRFRSVLAVSGYRLRARLDVSIPCSSPGQPPAFGYSAPHPSAEGTLMRIKLRDGLSPHLPDDTLISGVIVQFIYNNQQVIVTFMRPSASSSSR